MYGTPVQCQYIFVINQTAVLNQTGLSPSEIENKLNPYKVTSYYESQGAQTIYVYNMTYFKGFAVYVQNDELLTKMKNDPYLEMFNPNILGTYAQNSGITNNSGLNLNQTNSTALRSGSCSDTAPKIISTQPPKVLNFSEIKTLFMQNFTNQGLLEIAPSFGNLITNVNKTAVDVDVAVMDTGISLVQPQLNVYKAINFVNGSASVDDDVGHGSHVAGIIGAKSDGLGTVGIAHGARLWSLKVCDYRGTCNVADQIKAIEYITQHADEIDVVNISIENPYSQALNKAIEASVKAGVTYVVAAGNRAINSSLVSPASDPNVITVSAISDSDGKCGSLGPSLNDDFNNKTILDDSFAKFSNFGKKIDIAAPGVQILSTYSGNIYAFDSGTSMATPHVTGYAALLKSKYPNATPQEIKEMILDAAIQPGTVCQVDQGGYFSGDNDNYHEPLLYLGKDDRPGIERPES